MPIFACGINHKTAPVDLREQVVFAQDKLAFYLDDLIQYENIQEAVILSTCNRSELYCIADGAEQVVEWFCRQHYKVPDELTSALYLYEEAAAVEHIMHVACGLDSMILGESQILSQMKTAFSESSAAGALGTVFNRLFQYVFSVAKEVRNHTAIGACPVSVSSAAVQFVKQTVPLLLDQTDFLLIGAGVTVDLVLRHLRGEQPRRIFIANRSQENAEKLAHKQMADVIPLTELANILPDIDVLITATGGISPIVTKPMLTGRTKPLWIVDIAVPRDVDPAVFGLESVHLFCIDDLKAIISNNFQGREHAALKAREMIKQRCQEFLAWHRSFDVTGTTIRVLRKQIEDLTQIELQKAQKQLLRGDDPAQVLQHFSQALTNKLLHVPSVQLRQACYDGRLEVVELVQQLFAIPDLKIDPL